MSSEAVTSPRGGPQKPGFLSIRAYLQLLIAAIVVPMLALVAVLAWYYASAARRTIEAERLDVANNLTHLADREIRSIAGFLSGTSISPLFQSGDQRVLKVVGDAAQARGFEAVGIYDLDGGLQHASPAERRSVFPPGARVGTAEIVAGRPLFVSDLVPGVDPRPGLFFVSVPMMSDGRVARILSAGVSPRRLQFLIAEAGLRPEWRAGLVDRTGIMLARSAEAPTYVGQIAQQPMVDAARGTADSGLFDVVSRDGVAVANSFQRSKLTGWTAGVAVPAAVVHAPFWSTALILAAVGICFILLALLLGSLIASRIARAVHQLGQAVVAFANGDAVSLPSNTISELRDALRVIEGTSAMGRNRTSIPKE